jgi:glycosyltransferase involved in cell wall biosynthesis
MNRIRLSVIIPTYNESDQIIDCLKSLGRQTLKDFEVIVVDDGSTDNTLERLSEFQISNFKLQILETKHLGPGAARNVGAKSAKGRILVFVDADMTYAKNFLKELVKPIVKGASKGTFSKEEYVSNWNNVWARCWNINQGWEKKKRHPKRYPEYQKVFRAILSSEFKKVDGFTPGGYTDDYSLSDKLGYLANNAIGARFFHNNPSSLKEVFLHAKWVGKRRYKLGIFGSFIAIIRASFPISLLIGIIKSVFNLQPFFIVFKIVYDSGITLGILEFIVKGKAAK